MCSAADMGLSMGDVRKTSGHLSGQSFFRCVCCNAYFGVHLSSCVEKISAHQLATLLHLQGKGQTGGPHGLNDNQVSSEYSQHISSILLSQSPRWQEMSYKVTSSCVQHLEYPIKCSCYIVCVHVLTCVWRWEYFLLPPRSLIYHVLCIIFQLSYTNDSSFALVVMVPVLHLFRH